MLTQEQAEKKEKFYSEGKDNVGTQLRNASSSLDKIVLLFSSGALVLSITTVLGSVSTLRFVHFSLLYIAWFFLLLAIGSSIFSYFGSIKLALRRDEKLEAYSANKDTFAYSEKGDSKIEKWRWRILWSTLISVIILSLGILFLVVFAGLNIENLKNSSTIISTCSDDSLEKIREVFEDVDGSAENMQLFLNSYEIKYKRCLRSNGIKE